MRHNQRDVLDSMHVSNHNVWREIRREGGMTINSARRGESIQVMSKVIFLNRTSPMAGSRHVVVGTNRDGSVSRFGSYIRDVVKFWLRLGQDKCKLSRYNVNCINCAGCVGAESAF